MLRRWRAESNMSVPRRDLFLFIKILDGWFDNPAMPGIFQGPPQQPTTVGGKPQVDKLQAKEEKWGAYKAKVVAELETMAGEGWTVVYTDGSAKVVRGWAQAGFGAWYGPNALRNASDFIPLGEKQSVSRAELRGVLHAVRGRQWGERMVVVLDSEYVYKGITQWSSKWQRHQWRVSGRDVEHKGLWIAVLAERELAVLVVVCVARKLRPCPSYSRRRDRINLGLWRSLYKREGVTCASTQWYELIRKGLCCLGIQGAPAVRLFADLECSYHRKLIRPCLESLQHRLECCLPNAWCCPAGEPKWLLLIADVPLLFSDGQG